MTKHFFQTEEQRRRAFQDAGVDMPITTDVMQPVVPIEPIVTPPEIPAPAPEVPEIPEAFAMPEPVETQKETSLRELTERIIGGRKELAGVAEATAEAERVEGIKVKREELERARSFIASLQAERLQIPLQLQEEAKGRGITAEGLRPLQTARLRQNTISMLGASASFQVAAGDLNLALSFVDRAVDVEFQPIKDQLAIDLANLELLQGLPDLTSLEKRQVEERIARKQAEKETAEARKIEREEIYNIGLIAQQFGADTSVVRDIFEKATSREEAILMAGEFLQDPASKVKLQNLQLDRIIKTQKIKNDALKMDLLREYGGLTPEQFNEKLKEEQKEIKALTTATDKAKAQGRVLNEKSKLIDSILESKALDSVVGPTPFTRGFGRASGFVPKTISFFNIFGILDEFLGADDIVGLVEQLVSKEFLQNLIDVKAQGATFGALQKAEQDALTNAAIAIGNARIFSGKGEERKVIGYDLSEKQFKRQMNIVKTNADLAYKRSTGKSFMPDEQVFFDELETLQNQAAFNPAF